MVSVDIAPRLGSLPSEGQGQTRARLSTFDDVHGLESQAPRFLEKEQVADPSEKSGQLFFRLPLSFSPPPPRPAVLPQSHSRNVASMWIPLPCNPTSNADAVYSPHLLL